MCALRCVDGAKDSGCVSLLVRKACPGVVHSFYFFFQKPAQGFLILFLPPPPPPPPSVIRNRDSEKLDCKAVSSNILYIHLLESPLKDFILYISFLYNNVLYTQISILETFFIFIFYTYVFVILSNVLYIF
jgi:hypothetical protein